MPAAPGQRTMSRALKGLEDHTRSVCACPTCCRTAGPLRRPKRRHWRPGLLGPTNLRDIYLRANPKATTRGDVPVCGTRRRHHRVPRIREIIRMFNSAFDGPDRRYHQDFYPNRCAPDRRDTRSVYEKINNGVYKSGFATTQEAYDRAVHSCSSARLVGGGGGRGDLSQSRYLTGPVTRGRIGAVHHAWPGSMRSYHLISNANSARLIDYPNIRPMRATVPVAGVAGTIHFDHIVRTYITARDHQSQRIIRSTPVIEWMEPAWARPVHGP